MPTIMGLDFGTSNTTLALSQGGDVRIVPINSSKLDEHTLPSVLLFEKGRKFLVGQQAIEQYTQYESREQRFLQSLKSFLPDTSFPGTTIFGKWFDLESLVALVLKTAKTIGEQYAGCNVESVILGRPVLFSDDDQNDKCAEERLGTAASKAGFTSTRFEYEPIAATLAYLNQLTDSSEQIVLMGDFGGGTSDFSVMRINTNMSLTHEEKRRRILAIGGIHIGGDTFDGRIMWEKVTPYFGRDIRFTEQTLSMPRWIMYSLCEWHQIPFLRERKSLEIIRGIKSRANRPDLLENLEHLIRGNKGYAIFKAIEQAKKELSLKPETRISYRDQRLAINEAINRSEFEAAIETDIRKLRACVLEVIDNAGIRASDVTKVLLTGGSSFIPAVRRIFETICGKEKIVDIDAFTSVAHGLALSASAL
ncbi:MAG: Hsp70 family protein [Patescibacteria group bacterium]|nr:Hsp70 family protein [Patescibacteria group bacterium]